MIKTVVVCALAAVAWGYSAGAPETVCDDMVPKHPVDPQKSPIPYGVSVSSEHAKAGDVIDIQIAGKSGFKGFLIQVRDGAKAVGSFNIPETDKLAKAINCHGTPRSAATHKNSVEKNNLVLKWQAPQTAGTYQVFMTVARDGGTFWARQPGTKINIK